jgi:DNA polymerase
MDDFPEDILYGPDDDPDAAPPPPPSASPRRAAGPEAKAGIRPEPKDARKGATREVPQEAPKAASKDRAKDASKEAHREGEKDTSQASAKASSQASPQVAPQVALGEIGAKNLDDPELILSSPTLTELRNSLSRCALCDLCEGRRKVFTGRGTEDASLVLVTPPPKEEESREDSYPLPKERELLEKLLGEVFQMSLEEVYITPIVKCFPGSDKALHPSRHFCRAILLRELELIGPKAVVAMGNVASQVLKGSSKKVAELRLLKGQVLEVGDEQIPFRMVNSADGMIKLAEIKYITFADLFNFLTEIKLR